jgi:hypothetical protein
MTGHLTGRETVMSKGGFVLGALDFVLGALDFVLGALCS